MLLCVLAALLLGAGIRMVTLRLERQETYLNLISQAQYLSENPDTAELDALEAEKENLTTQTDDLNTQIQALEEALAGLDQDVDQLQQEYDQLAQGEDSSYYQAIFQSLTEGVSLVESYLNGNE